MTSSATQPRDPSITFGDDATLDVQAIVWATGFRVGHSWIDGRRVARASDKSTPNP
ncbi:MAG: hypothetical protein QOJ81_1916 [Chloroflexota bacterium]|jgi:hypothetical protein|nr:hypothetical protein [Chloroflexota bacterium]